MEIQFLYTILYLFTFFLLSKIDVAKNTSWKWDITKIIFEIFKMASKKSCFLLQNDLEWRYYKTASFIYRKIPCFSIVRGQNHHQNHIKFWKVMGFPKIFNSTNFFSKIFLNPFMWCQNHEKVLWNNKNIFLFWKRSHFAILFSKNKKINFEKVDTDRNKVNDVLERQKCVPTLFLKTWRIDFLKKISKT